jgi:hypothetical protein
MKSHSMGRDTAAKIEAHIRKHRAAGGKAAKHDKPESPDYGDDDAEADLKDKPERYNKSKVEDEGEEMHAKRGGRAKRKEGGKAVACEGGKPKMPPGRKVRASGGSCESNPFTSAASGTRAPGREVQAETDGRNR